MAEVPKILIYLLRRDLRLADNPVFHEISQTFRSKRTGSLAFTHLLPIYVFAADQIEVSGFLKPSDDLKQYKSPYPEARSRVAGFWRCGPHRAKFLGESVWDLKSTLESIQSGLCIRVGRVPDVVRDTLSYFAENKGRGDIVGVWMTGEEASEEKTHEVTIRKLLERQGKQFRLFKDEKYFVDDDDLEIDKISDLPDVFTSFRKSLEPLRERPRKTLLAPDKLPPYPADDLHPPTKPEFFIPDTLAGLIENIIKPLRDSVDLQTPPIQPADDIATYNAHPFPGGETTAMNRLVHLLQSGAMSSYKDTRNGMVGTEFSTKLSSFLSIGCLTARQIHAEMTVFEDGASEGVSEKEKSRFEGYRQVDGFGRGQNPGTQGVRFELLWRDYMRLCSRKFKDKLFHLDGFRNVCDKRWITATEASHNGRGVSGHDVLSRFLSGHTGIGLIDASQRELYWTGYTSNRARQNVASFLAKHLNIDWRIGAEWYESMLMDYDVASNWGNWQYVAGVGNDPRDGRIFNPVKQALDYDPKGEYIMTWIPELRRINIADEQGAVDSEKIMGLFQAWRLSTEDKQDLGLSSIFWVEDPLLKIQFSVVRKPRSGGRGRGGFRERGGGPINRARGGNRSKGA